MVGVMHNEPLHADKLWPRAEVLARPSARQTLLSPLALDPLINIEATIPSGSMPQYPT